jgi:hypothetical protein
MRFKKRVQAREYETEAYGVCDFCKTAKLGARGYECSEVTLKAEIGEVYPEQDCRDIEAFDCCPGCWKTKVRPALEALGGHCYEYDVDEGRIKTMPFDER